MIRVRNIKIDIMNDTDDNITWTLEKKLKTKIIDYKIVKKSIDARREIVYVYTFDVEVENEEKILRKNKDVILTPNEEYSIKITGRKKLRSRPVIVGAGPAGLFLGYMLSSLGYKPLIIERGEQIEKTHNFKSSGR